MAFVHLIWAMFVYGCGFCFIHHGTPTGSFPESFVQIRLDLAEICRIKNVYLFVCLFIDLFFVCFNDLGKPTGSYPEKVVKIRLDLAKIFRI